jgi:hypothetical protein
MGATRRNLQAQPKILKKIIGTPKLIIFLETLSWKKIKKKFQAQKFKMAAEFKMAMKTFFSFLKFQKLNFS